MLPRSPAYLLGLSAHQAAVAQTVLAFLRLAFSTLSTRFNSARISKHRAEVNGGHDARLREWTGRTACFLPIPDAQSAAQKVIRGGICLLAAEATNNCRVSEG